MCLYVACSHPFQTQPARVGAVIYRTKPCRRSRITCSRHDHHHSGARTRAHPTTTTTRYTTIVRHGESRWQSYGIFSFRPFRIPLLLLFFLAIPLFHFVSFHFICVCVCKVHNDSNGNINKMPTHLSRHEIKISSIPRPIFGSICAAILTSSGSITWAGLGPGGWGNTSTAMRPCPRPATQPKAQWYRLGGGR